MGAALWAFPACGGDDDDDVSIVDSGAGTGVDGGADCANHDQGEIGALAGTLAQVKAQDFPTTPPPEGHPTDAQFWDLIGAASDADIVEVQLWDGFGVFNRLGDGDARRVVPGTYALTEEDAVIESCGICLLLIAGVNPDEDTIDRFYLATSGNVTVDSIGGVGETLAGSASDVVLREVDGETLAPVQGGCAANIASFEFSAAVEAAPEE
ncbi:MAG TPA: hypothetical protein VK698_09415 [Kofleriaceae bacterium]|nr:hypothetical protein [Kofleriaceae bacterium]